MGDRELFAEVPFPLAWFITLRGFKNSRTSARLNDVYAAALSQKAALAVWGPTLPVWISRSCPIGAARAAHS